MHGRFRGMGEPVLLQVPHVRPVTRQAIAQIEDFTDDDALLRLSRSVHYRMAIVQGTWKEVLSVVGDADDEVQDKARPFLESLGYKTPRAAMMADIESHILKPRTWPGGPVDALILDAMQHLAS